MSGFKIYSFSLGTLLEWTTHKTKKPFQTVKWKGFSKYINEQISSF